MLNISREFGQKAHGIQSIKLLWHTDPLKNVQYKRVVHTEFKPNTILQVHNEWMVNVPSPSQFFFIINNNYTLQSVKFSRWFHDLCETFT